MRKDYSTSGLSRPDILMLDYAVKLTQNPSSIKEEDIETLRDNGFNDRAIHDICCVASYFNFVNRLADGLGVKLEENVR